MLLFALRAGFGMVGSECPIREGWSDADAEAELTSRIHDLQTHGSG